MLDDHGGTHDERSDINGIFCGKIHNPKEEGGMSHLDPILKSIIKGDEYRNLDEHWEATTHGVDLPPFVKKHDLLLKPCLIVLVLLFEPVHLRLHFLHLLHRLEADLCQGKEDDLDQDAEDDDIDPKIFSDGMGEP